MTAARLRPALLAAAATIATLPTLCTAARIWSGYPQTPLTANHATVVQDYLVMWVAGRSAAAGDAAALAGTAAFNAQVSALLGPGIDQYYWLYSPLMLLLAVPFAALPLMAGFAAWGAAGAAALWLALRLAGLARPLCAALLLSPAALESAVDGQNGALLAAGVVGALALPRRLAWLGGLSASLLVLKPQVALAVPVALAAVRNWPVILWALAFAAAWAALSVLCFGAAPWLDYARVIIPEARAVHLGMDTVPFGTLYLQNLVVTPFAALRSAGVAPPGALLAQGAVSAAVLAGVWRIWSEGGPGLAVRLAFTGAAIPLATPYAMTYDMIVPSLACLLMAPAATTARGLLYPAVLAWVWPGLALYAGAGLGVPGLGALVYASLALAIWRSAMARPAPGWQLAGIPAREP